MNAFANGSASGPSAFSIQVLLDCANDGQLKEDFLVALKSFVSDFARGLFPVEIAPFYGGARLIPLAKKDGGVRPMAVGEVFRRLVGKVLLPIFKEDIDKLLLPHQLGVGVSGGAEAVIHSVASCMENLEVDEAILQIDFSNAFNLVNREVFLKIVKESLPGLLNVANFLYANKGRLVITKDMLMDSSDGVQQGCPLASVLFSLVLNILVNSIKDKFPHLKLNLWYLDDGHLCGKVDDLVKIIALINEEGKNLGLFLNLSKCVAFGQNLQTFPSEIIRAEGGLNVLGAPVGDKEFVRLGIGKLVKKFEKIFEKSRLLQNPQQQLLILRCSTGTPKMIYWMRTVDPEMITLEIEEFDRNVNSALQHIVGIPLDVKARDVAHLPLSLGGLGISVAAKISRIAFISSVGSTLHLQPNKSPREAYHRVKSLLQNIEIPNIDASLMTVNPLPTLQKDFCQRKLCVKNNLKLKENILENADDRFKTLLIGRCAKGSSFWLTKFPNKWLKTAFDPASFRAMIKYSLGIPQFSNDHNCPDCGKEMDKFGDHAMTCRVSSGTIHKHNSIRDVLLKELKSAGVTCSSEQPSLIPQANREVPGDLFIPDFDVYGDAYFDVSVINILCPSYIDKSVKGPLCGAEIRYVNKMKKYEKLAENLKPLIVECTGGWHAHSYKYIQGIAELISFRSNQVENVVMKRILSALSFCLQRHQGTMVVRRCAGLM